MKLAILFLLASTAALVAQEPAAKAPAAAEAPAAAAAQASGHATLAALQADFQQKKFAALDAYAKANPKASDVGDALTEAVQLAQELGRPDDVLRLADVCLATDGSNLAMHLARAGSLRDKGDVAGAQKVFEKVIADAGDDVNSVVEGSTQLADMLVGNGQKEAGLKVLADVGEQHSKVRGLKQHLEGIAKNYELIGTEPTAMGQNDTAGKPIDLAEYKGKVLLIDFWATWCGPCIAELPNVIAAYQKHHDKGFEILGVSLDEDRAAFEKFIADKKMTWRHHFDGNGWKNEIGQAYGVQSIPATYLVGPDGKVAAVGLRGDKLEKEVAKLLAKSAK
jgi:thiol-disulfide isomerase/thioredoxin